MVDKLSKAAHGYLNWEHEAVDRAEFALVRDSVEITGSTLSKQVAILEAAGYVGVDKGRVGRRPRTWLYLTDLGRDALLRRLTALQDIASLSATIPARTRRG
ncbi:MAG: transcriptional regulator [Pseudonocardiaceae bacterium]